MDTDNCEFLPGIPLPFSRQLVKEAFVYPEDIYPDYEEMDRKQIKNMHQLRNHSLDILSSMLVQLAQEKKVWNVIITLNEDIPNLNFQAQLENHSQKNFIHEHVCLELAQEFLITIPNLINSQLQT